MNNHIVSAGLSHLGKIARQNEDDYICNNELGLYIIADGMGGHAAGEIASKLAINTVTEQFEKGHSLAHAIDSAHQAVLSAMHHDQQLRGMGTTLVAAQIKPENTYQIAWVGDSRCYHWSDTFFKQVTNDHSLLQALLASGNFSHEQASKHPESKSLTQAVGVSERMSLQVGTYDGQLMQNEYLLLCSDGLTDELSDGDIQTLINQDASPEQISQRLINAALAMGGRDNITVIIISAPALAPKCEDNNEQITDTDQPQKSFQVSKLFNWFSIMLLILLYKPF